MPKANSEVDTLIAELYQVGTHYLNAYPWEFESDRWAELAICALVVGHELDPAVVKESIHSLARLRLLSVPGLAAASAQEQAFIAQVFNQHGCNMANATQACSTLVSLAAAVQEKWKGHLQRFLREHGEKMSHEMQAVISSAGVGRMQSRKIAVLWLQNVANLPILLPDDPHIQEFCHNHGISQSALVDTADRLDLNVAVLDDLIALETQAAEASRATSAGKRAKNAKKRGNGRVKR